MIILIFYEIQSKAAAFTVLLMLFSVHFLIEKFCILNFIEVYTLGSSWQYLSIGLDNGLAPNKRQAIIWTNGDSIHWRIYATLGGDTLRNPAVCLRQNKTYISLHHTQIWSGIK